MMVSATTKKCEQWWWIMNLNQHFYGLAFCEVAYSLTHPVRNTNPWMRLRENSPETNTFTWVGKQKPYFLSVHLSSPS